MEGDYFCHDYSCVVCEGRSVSEQPNAWPEWFDGLACALRSGNTERDKPALNPMLSESIGPYPASLPDPIGQGLPAFQGWIGDDDE